MAYRVIFYLLRAMVFDNYLSLSVRINDKKIIIQDVIQILNFLQEDIHILKVLYLTRAYRLEKQNKTKQKLLYSRQYADFELSSTCASDCQYRRLFSPEVMSILSAIFYHTTLIEFLRHGPTFNSSCALQVYSPYSGSCVRFMGAGRAIILEYLCSANTITSLFSQRRPVTHYLLCI